MKPANASPVRFGMTDGAIAAAFFGFLIGAVGGAISYGITLCCGACSGCKAEKRHKQASFPFQRKKILQDLHNQVFYGQAKVSGDVRHKSVSERSETKAYLKIGDNSYVFYELKGASGDDKFFDKGAQAMTHWKLQDARNDITLELTQWQGDPTLRNEEALEPRYRVTKDKEEFEVRGAKIPRKARELFTILAATVADTHTAQTRQKEKAAAAAVQTLVKKEATAPQAADSHRKTRETSA